MTSCSRIREIVAEHSGGNVPLPRRVERHLAGCAACAEEARSIRIVIESASSLDPPEPGDAYWEGFLPGVRRRIEIARHRRERVAGAHVLRYRLALPLAAAAAMILAVGTAWFAWRSAVTGPARIEPSAADADVDSRLRSAGLVAGLDAMESLTGNGSDDAMAEGTAVLPSGGVDAGEAGLVSAFADATWLLGPADPGEWTGIEEFAAEMTDEEAKALVDSLMSTDAQPASGPQEGSAG